MMANRLPPQKMLYAVLPIHIGGQLTVYQTEYTHVNYLIYAKWICDRECWETIFLSRFISLRLSGILFP